MKFVVIGDGTDRGLANFGFCADYMPDSFCAETSARGLASTLIGSDHVLIARSKGGLPILTSILGKTGLVYDDIVLYQVEGGLASEQRRAEERFDYITFASTSDVRAYFSSSLNINPGQRTGQTGLVCIGDITVGELKKHRIKADIITGTYRIQGLVQAIADDAISCEAEDSASV